MRKRLVVLIFAFMGLTLSTIPLPGDQAPFGRFETPGDETTVRGSIAVTGWALDDVGVESVKIYREENGNLVYIGDASFVEGARPDVESEYPNYPNNSRAGWGYMMLTNFLPGEGNGTVVIHAVAADSAGRSTTLGIKTIHCDNANAVKPFGAIDTPQPGETVSGRNYRVQGWALTPLPNKIPEDGSTIRVLVDNVDVGQANYNIYRSDISSLFPGYANSEAALAYFDLNTTNYTNGVHTLVWIVTDDAGNTDGIGSRYFTVENKSIEQLYLKAELPTPSGATSFNRASTQSSAVKTIILATDRSFRSVEVTGTTVNIDITREIGSPLGIIFADQTDGLLGALNIETTEGDLNVLPLTVLTGSEIDLGKITFGLDSEGNRVATPEHDPIGVGKVIDMTETEKGAYAITASILSAAMKYPDADSNGIVDTLENRLYKLAFMYWYEAGQYPDYQPGDGEYNGEMPNSVKLHGFLCHCGYIAGDGQNSTVGQNNRYPIRFPDTWDPSWERGHYTGNDPVKGDDGTNNNNGPDGGTHPPTDGFYTVTVTDDGDSPYDVRFYITNQDKAVENDIMASPTFYVKDGMFQKVTWSWKLRNNIQGPLVNPLIFIKDLTIQVNDHYPHDTVRIYNSCGNSDRYDWAGVYLTGAEGEHILGRDDVPWVECDSINFAYNDHFGNHVVTVFKRSDGGN